MNMNTKTPEPKKKKSLQGTVVKAAMKDTATVMIARYVKHDKYKKFVKINKKFLVDDKGNTAKVGDVVQIESTRPISKNKHFRIVR